MNTLCDIHSHILPGLDDGARDFTRSIEMLQHAYEEGIHIINATPHYLPGHTNAPASEIKEKAAQLQEYADAHQMDMKLYVGNEIFYSHEASRLIEAGEILTLADSNAVLVEFSPAEDFRYIKNSFIELLSEGYRPILAHAERYDCLDEKKLTNARMLDEMGVMLQINTSSVSGTKCRKYAGLAKRC